MIVVERVPHPVASYAEAQRNRQEICDRRGYCGPFINMAVYDAFPDPVWHGCGECVNCCGTRKIAEEEGKRARAMAASGAPIPAPLPSPS